jgi:hypothetical protein
VVVCRLGTTYDVDFARNDALNAAAIQVKPPMFVSLTNRPERYRTALGGGLELCEAYG